MRIEIRENQVLLDGYVNAVERESRVLPSPRGRFKEKIKPKTFEKALRKADNVELRFNHDPNRKLGSIQEGNLQLFEDNIGLRAIATVSDEAVINKAKNGELRGWSFGFIDLNPDWQDGEDGISLRYLSEIDLIEVSILDKTPAYIATSIEARGEEEVISEQRSDEFRAEIEDLTKQEEEKREDPVIDYSIFEKEIELLKLKGGKH
ncbi:MAG: peptidase [Neobacillus sp.]|nr:peptidase [Neobacillus sp.]